MNDTNDNQVMIQLQLAAPKDQPEQDWFFTFGSGHAHPNCYVKIHGTFSAAREEMFCRYGPKWCLQYANAEEAGVERWNLREVQ